LCALDFFINPPTYSSKETFSSKPPDGLRTFGEYLLCEKGSGGSVEDYRRFIISVLLLLMGKSLPGASGSLNGEA
jgi:hypothetical protein